jgi:hypothetical protein
VLFLTPIMSLLIGFTLKDMLMSLNPLLILSKGIKLSNYNFIYEGFYAKKRDP